MENIYYKKVFIKNISDLPKDIIIHVGNKSGFEELVYIEGNETKKPWRYDEQDIPTISIDRIVWYLQPKELPSEDAIDKWADYCAGNSVKDFNTKVLIKASLSLGAKWLKSQITK